MTRAGYAAGAVGRDHGRVQEQLRHDLANLIAVLAARTGLSRRAPEQGAESPAGPGIVLVLEDEPVLRNLVQQGLAERGWTAISAEHPEDALGLAAAYAEGIDAVVADVVMPRTTGRALVERLRRALPRLGVVFVSGHPPGHALVPPPDEHTAFLQKPFTLDELDGALRSLLA